MKYIIAPIIFIIGIILICSFLVPAWQSQSIRTYPNYTSSQYFTNIFTDYSIDYHRLFLYILIWTLLCIALHFIFKNFGIKKN